jgi:hypothetical protein
MGKFKAYATLTGVILFFLGLVSSIFLDWGTIFSNSRLAMEETTEQTVDIRLDAPRSFAGGNNNTNEVNSEYREQLQESINQRNEAQRQAVINRMKEQEGGAGGFYLGDQILDYSTSLQDDESEVALANANANCIQCPGISDKELEEKIAKIVGDARLQSNTIESKQLKAMLTEDGTIALLDGKPVLVDENGTLINPETLMPILKNGRLLTEENLLSNLEMVLTDELGRKFSANGSKLFESEIRPSDLVGMTHKGQPVYVDENGQLRYKNSNAPVLDENNEAIFYNPSSGFVSASGEKSALNDSLRSADGSVLEGSEKFSRLQQNQGPSRNLYQTDLEGMTYGGRATTVGADGRLQYMDGTAVTDENGEEVFYREGAGFVTRDGKVASTGTKLKTANGEIVSGNEVISTAPPTKALTRSDFNGMTYGGRATTVGADGRLKYMDGTAVTDENGEEVFYREGAGFVTRDGKVASTGTKLKTANGEIVSGNEVIDNDMNRDINLQNTSRFQRLNEEQAKMLAARFDANRNSLNNIEDDQVGADRSVSQNLNSGMRAAQKVIGNFIVNENGFLLSNDYEELLYKGNNAKVDASLKIENTKINFERESNKFVSENSLPVFFKSKVTGKFYDAQGIEIDYETPVFVKLKNGALTVPSGNVLFNGEAVYINKNNELRTSQGDSITNFSDEKISYSAEIGIVQNDVDGIFTNENGEALNRFGNVLLSSAGNKLLSEFSALRFLKNGIILRSNKPVFDRTGQKLLVKPDVVDGQKQISIVNQEGIVHDNLNVKSNGGLLELFSGEKKTIAANEFVYDHKRKKVRLQPSEIEFRLLGTEFYVSTDGYLYSDPDGDDIVLSSDFSPYILREDGQLINKGKLISPISNLSSKSLDQEVLLNVDGAPLFDLEGNTQSAIYNDNIEATTIMSGLFPNIDTALLLGGVFKDPIATSSSKRLYQKNDIIKTVQNGILLGAESGAFSSNLDDDAPMFYDSTIKSEGGFISDGGQMIVSDKGLLPSNSYQLIDGRLLNSNKVVKLPQMSLISYASPLISNDSVLNLEYLNSVKTAGDMLILDGLLITEEGEIIKQGNQILKVTKDGRVVDGVSNQNIEGATGPLFLDKNKGFVDGKGQKNKVDYLITKSGKSITNTGEIALDKPNLKLSSHPNYAGFMFDDNGGIYNKDGLPVIANGSHLKLSEGNVTSDGANLLFNGETITLKNGELVTKNGSLPIEINKEGGFFEKETLNSAKGLFESIFDNSKSGFDKLTSSFNSNPIRATEFENSSYGEESNDSESDTNNSKIMSGSDDNVSQKQMDGVSNLPVQSKIAMLSIQEATLINSFDLSEIQTHIDKLDNLVRSKFNYSTAMLPNNAENTSENGEVNIQQGAATGQDITANSNESTNVSQEVSPYPYANVQLLPEDAVVVLKKGTKLEARISTPFASTATGYLPMAMISSGALRGAYLSASSVVMGSTDMTLVFGDEIRLRNGNKILTSGNFALSIDPKTGYPGTGADVNNHFWEKMLKLVPLSMLTKTGEFIELTKQQTATTSSTTASSQVISASVPSAEELALIIAGQGAAQAGTIIQSDLDSLIRELKLREGQRIQVMVTEDVVVKRSAITAG